MKLQNKGKHTLIYKDCTFGKGNTQNNPFYEKINGQNKKQKGATRTQETSEEDNQEADGD